MARLPIKLAPGMLRMKAIKKAMVDRGMCLDTQRTRHIDIIAYTVEPGLRPHNASHKHVEATLLQRIQRRLPTCLTFKQHFCVVRI